MSMCYVEVTSAERICYVGFARYCRVSGVVDTGRFQGPSGRAPFSDEGGFTFGRGGLKGA